MAKGQDFLRSGAVTGVNCTMVPSEIEAGGNTAHNESRHVMTEVQSLVSTEESGDQLELGTLERMQFREVSSSLPTTVPTVADKKA